MVNALKYLNTFLFLFSNKMLVIRLEFTKSMTEYKTVKTLIRQLLQKQSDQGLHCLSGPFWWATNIQNFKTFTVSICTVCLEVSEYSKTYVKQPLKKDKTNVLITNGSLMKVKSIAVCSPKCILQQS